MFPLWNFAKSERAIAVCDSRRLSNLPKSIKSAGSSSSTFSNPPYSSTGLLSLPLTSSPPLHPARPLRPRPSTSRRATDGRARRDTDHNNAMQHRPLPHFTAPPSLRPANAPAPHSSTSPCPLPSTQPIPARGASLKRVDNDGGVTGSHRGAGQVPLRERQADEGPPTDTGQARQTRFEHDAVDGYSSAQAGGVGSWNNEQENPLQRSSPPSSAPHQAPPVTTNLSRMNSTRRYMAELDADDEDDDEQDEVERLRNGGRLTWQTGASAYESEARDSVASLQAPSFALVRGNSQKSARSTGGKGGLPRESTASALTVASMDGPFGYSVRSHSALLHEPF